MGPFPLVAPPITNIRRYKPIHRAVDNNEMERVFGGVWGAMAVVGAVVGGPFRGEIVHL